MRLHRLELEGFGPFADPQVVDFDAFEADGIFLITGRTGAGKSSILDGVCFALYAAVPRYGGGEKRLRSDFSAPDQRTRVVLEFTAADVRWRVTRSPEYFRAKQRGEGLRRVPAEAQLDEWDGDGWVGRASGPRNVAEHLHDLLQLTMQQFLQVILLAQNRFARFLLADNKERQALLRTLFGSRRLHEYEFTFEERRKRAERDLERGGAGLSLLLGEAERLVDEHGLGAPADGAAAGDMAIDDAAIVDAEVIEKAAVADDAEGDPEQTPDGPELIDSPTALESTALRLERVERALARADYRAETHERQRSEADHAYRAAQARHASRVAVRGLQEQRLDARATLAELERRAEEILGDRIRLERAIRAETTRVALFAVEAAADALVVTARAESAAERAWRDAHDDEKAPLTPDDLRALADRMSGDLAVWAQAQGEEQALTAAETAHDALRVRIDEQERALSDLAATRADVPKAIAAIDDQLRVQLEAAGALPGARAQLSATQERLTAAREADGLLDALRQAERIHSARLDELDSAVATVSALLRRRLAGYAGELASALIDGEPCAVCGALEHPQPAHSNDEPVTDDQFAAAEAAKDAATDVERAAAAAVREARAAHGSAAARAGGESVEALEQRHSADGDAVASAECAAAESVRLQAERDSLVSDDELARAEHDRVATALAADRDSASVIAAEVAASRRRIDAARGEFTTVSARIADVTHARERARALADAIDAHAAQVIATDHARAERDSQIAAAGFADVDEAQGALLEADVRVDLDKRIRAYEAELERERARLRDLELELADEPDELVDLGVTAELVEAARNDWVAHVESTRSAIDTAAQLRDYVTRAVHEAEDIAHLAAAHAAIAEVANTVAGRNEYRMTLETFVLAAELEEIVAAANLRLDEMSAGRYRLRHSDSLAAHGAASGLGLEIADAHTGRTRPTASLSGGETFLASLALALGLAEVVTGRAMGIRLDTLFIDEGFGALDPETLELAMRTLDSLRQGGRTIGVISHVEAMKERLPARLEVTATPQGPSTIRQEQFSLTPQ